MSVLSDVDISRRIGRTKRAMENDYYWTDLDETGLLIEPYDEDNVQPASYDLTLGNEFVKHRYAGSNPPSSIDNGPMADRSERVVGDDCVMDPQDFVLAHTRETIRVPNDITAEVKGRSSLGRLGLIPHTAGWIDPGFEGQITLEFVNHSPHPVKIQSGMRCAQIVFTETTSPASDPYGSKSDSKYQGQTGVTGSRIEEDQS